MAAIRFLGCDQDAFCASVARHVSEFEEASGHRVDVQLIANDEYFANKLAPYLGGESPADVYMSGPVLMWEQLGQDMSSHWTRFSNEPAPNTTPTTSLPHSCVQSLERELWRALGEGPLLELPVNCESYNLAYLPAVLERVGAEVPSTWDDYFAVARQIAERAALVAGSASVERTCGTPSTRDSQASLVLWRGRFRRDRRVRDRLSGGIRATGDILAALRDAGPADWSNQRWYELAIDFAHGHYGLIVDSDHYVAYFEIRRSPQCPQSRL